MSHTMQKSEDSVCLTFGELRPNGVLGSSAPPRSTTNRAVEYGSAGSQARHLPDGDGGAVPEVDQGDLYEQGRERRLVEVPGGLLEDPVWHRIRPVGKAGGGLRERQRGALGFGEVGCLPPSRHREEALVRFALLLEVAGVHVHAVAAAVDLGRA